MFTGLIEAVGEVVEVKPTPAGFRLRLTTNIAPEVAAGDSLAVNGVCLTVVSSDASGVHADISPETVRVSALGTLRRGVLVNLERPLRADARLGGHFVQGHVDATGTIDELRPDGDSFWLTIRYPALLAPYIVRRGRSPSTASASPSQAWTIGISTCKSSRTPGNTRISTSRSRGTS